MYTPALASSMSQSRYMIASGSGHLVYRLDTFTGRICLYTYSLQTNTLVKKAVID